MAIPLLDHILVELEAKFSQLTVKSTRLLGLIPAVMMKSTVDISELTQMYKDDLPLPLLIEEELYRWKLQFASTPSENLPDSCAQAIQACSSKDFPNIFILLKIACTIPVTSCECERSFSVIRRLRTYLRCTMAHERLSALALMHINYDTDINVQETVNIFADMYPRRLQLKSLLFE